MSVTLAIPEHADAAERSSAATLTTRRAYLALLLIYAVMFGACAVLSIADFLTLASIHRTATTGSNDLGSPTAATDHV
jgi:hypothetical protein